MKTISKYALGVWALVAATAGFTSCQDDFDDPNSQAPVASKTPNTTILELKTLTWDDSRLEAYVNLRCVNFDKHRWCIYTGGGITADSTAASTLLRTCGIMHHSSSKRRRRMTRRR